MKSIVYRACLVAAIACALSLPARAAPEAPQCVFSPVAKFPLRYTGPSLMITTAGTINGTPAELLVDTGAFQTFFTRTGTERRNMPLRRTGRTVGGIGGWTPVFETRIADFSAGPSRATSGFIPVLSDFGFTPSFDGILGAPFLLQADLEIWLAAKEMTMFHTENCATTYLGYWDDKVIDIPFKPDHVAGTNPHFTVSVNGREMEAMIDTGSATSSIVRAAARRAGFEVDPGTSSHKSVGVGSRKVLTWMVSVDTFNIGGEAVRNAELAVIDTPKDKVDVILGADFMRAHRVLFAMSQKTLYFSYVGGEPFGQRQKLEPWIRTEADKGNADAQLALSEAYRLGKGVARDDALAAQLLEKAAAGGSPHALLQSGRALMLRGDLARGTTRLRAALDQLPAERDGALWLYIARVRAGQAELAKEELAATFARSEGNEWPKPVADVYLGTLSGDKLLAQTTADRTDGGKRHCQTVVAVVEWQLAHGRLEQAQAHKAEAEAACGAARTASTQLP